MKVNDGGTIGDVTGIGIDINNQQYSAYKAVADINGNNVTIWEEDDGGTPPNDYLNLAYEVPTKAVNLWHDCPATYEEFIAENPTTDVTNYANGGDLSNGVTDASANGYFADLGVGNTYDWESMGTASGNVYGWIGKDCTINWSRSDVTYMMQPNCNECIVTGADIDIRNGGGGCIFAPNVSSLLYATNIAIVGQRNIDTESANTRYTWRPHLTSSEGVGICENIDLSDGEANTASGTPPGSTYSQGFSVDDGHDGYLVVKDCITSGWLGNGFYMSYTDSDNSSTVPAGETVLWNPTAINNHRGNVRVGAGSTVIGGSVEINDMDDNLQGQGLVINQSSDPNNPTEVIGLTISGNDYAAEAIVARRHFTPNNKAHLRKVVLEAQADNRPIRTSTYEGGSLEVEFEDCYLYHDKSSSPNALLTAWSGDIIFNDDVRIESTATNNDIQIDSGASLILNGDTKGSGTFSSDDLGLGDPLEDYGGLPSFGFDYEAAGIAK